MGKKEGGILILGGFTRSRTGSSFLANERCKRESQKYFDFDQRLRFIAATAAINIYRFAPRLLRYGGSIERSETGEAAVYPAHISTL